MVYPVSPVATNRHCCTEHKDGGDCGQEYKGRSILLASPKAAHASDGVSIYAVLRGRPIVHCLARAGLEQTSPAETVFQPSSHNSIALNMNA
jgi:hypothetical protein